MGGQIPGAETVTGDTDRQRRIASIALDASENAGFALAGSGAIREHGLIDRPTEDIDLFTISKASASFKPTVAKVVTALREHAFQVDIDRQSESFARLSVYDPEGDYQTEIDMGLDYRSSPPSQLSIGPVLSLKDAVANKVTALFSRNETRDYLDFDSIRRRSQFSDDELIDLAKETDPGFDSEYFAQVLDRVSHIRPDEVEPYGYTSSDLEGVQKRLSSLADQIRKAPTPDHEQKTTAKGRSELLMELDQKTKNRLGPAPGSSLRPNRPRR